LGLVGVDDCVWVGVGVVVGVAVGVEVVVVALSFAAHLRDLMKNLQKCSFKIQ